MENTSKRACSSILASIEKEFYPPGLLVDLSKKVMETQPSEVLVAGVLQGMLNNNYKNMDMVSPSKAGYMDLCTGWMKEAPLTKYTCSIPT